MRHLSVTQDYTPDLGGMAQQTGAAARRPAVEQFNRDRVVRDTITCAAACVGRARSRA